MRATSGQVAIFLLGNSDHMISNNNNMLRDVIRREERSLTADKKGSWFEPTISASRVQGLECRDRTHFSDDWDLR